MAAPPRPALAPPPLPVAQPLRTMEELRSWAPWKNPSDLFLRGSTRLRRPGARRKEEAGARTAPTGQRETDGRGKDESDIRVRSSPAPHPPLRGTAGASTESYAAAKGVRGAAAALAWALSDSPEGARPTPEVGDWGEGRSGAWPHGPQLGASADLEEKAVADSGSEMARGKHGAAERRLLVCHDMAGGYQEDKWPQGIGCSSIYRIWDWPIVDTFVYFSHCHVTIPPPFWINCCHLQGTRVLGTFITEWTDGAAMCREILESEESVRFCARQLARIAQFYRFDGWLFNIENEVPPDRIPLLVLFVAALTEEVHALCPDPLVLWYDSVTKEGRLAWQDALNSHNLCFFEACDGIFTNYSWKETSRTPQESGEAAGPGRAGDVFMGVDVWDVPGRAGKGFRTGDVVGIAMGDGVSAAVFAPAWVYESKQPPSFFEASQRLWGGMHFAVEAYGGGAQAGEECNTARAQKWRGGCRAQVDMLPFFSSFDVGVGSAMWVQGRQVSASEWGNLSCETCWPCLAPLGYATSAEASGSQNGPGDGTGAMKHLEIEESPTSNVPSAVGPTSIPVSATASVTESVAFEGGASLQISAKGFNPSPGHVLRSSLGSIDPELQIFTARLPSTEKLHVSYSVLPLDEAEMCLALQFQACPANEPNGQQQQLDSPITSAVEAGLRSVHLHAGAAVLPPEAPSLSVMLLPSSPLDGGRKETSQKFVALLPTAEAVVPAHIAQCADAHPNATSSEQTARVPLVPSPWTQAELPCASSQATTSGLDSVRAEQDAKGCAKGPTGTEPYWVVREYEVGPMQGMALAGISAVLLGNGVRPVGLGAHMEPESSVARVTEGSTDGAQLYLGHVRIASASVAACLGSMPACMVRVEEATWQQNGPEGGTALTARLLWEGQPRPACLVRDAQGLERTSNKADASEAASASSIESGACEGTCEGCALYRFDVYAAPEPSQADSLPDCAATWHWVGVSFCQGFHVEKLGVPAGTVSLRFKIQPRMLCGARMPLDESPATPAIKVPSAL